MAVPFWVAATLSFAALFFALWPRRPKARPAAYQAARSICPCCDAVIPRNAVVCTSCRTDISGMPAEREYRGLRYTVFPDGGVGLRARGTTLFEESEAKLIESVTAGRLRDYVPYDYRSL